MIHGSDIVTVGLLVALEAMLSADNALVMAVIVLGLPRHLPKKALRQGLIGAFTFRVIAAQLLKLVERYPPLVDGAFVIIAWVGIELALEYLNSAGYIALEIPKALSLGLIIAIFIGAYIYARAKGPVEHALDPMEEK